MPKTYLLNKDTPYYPQASPSRVSDHATFSIDSGSKTELYGTSSIHTGIVVLTRADLRAGIGSGTFEFTASSTADRTKTITITKGRFDYHQ